MFDSSRGTGEAKVLLQTLHHDDDTQPCSSTRLPSCKLSLPLWTRFTARRSSMQEDCRVRGCETMCHANTGNSCMPCLVPCTGDVFSQTLLSSLTVLGITADNNVHCMPTISAGMSFSRAGDKNVIAQSLWQSCASYFSLFFSGMCPLKFIRTIRWDRSHP